MSKNFKNVVFASIFAIATFGSMQVASAAAPNNKNTQIDQGKTTDNGGVRNKVRDTCTDEQNCVKRDRSVRSDRLGENRFRVGRVNRDRQFDGRRQERRRNKSLNFQFYFGGFYYPQPYWQYRNDRYGYNRISCAEGRRIVAERGYNRVRIVECNGRQFTYTGRRYGIDYRFGLNSRSGVVVSRREI